VEEKALMTRIRELLAENRFAVLATRDDSGTFCSLVSYLETDDLKSLVFPTRKNTRKFRELCRYSRISLMVDKRPPAGDRVSRGEALTITGEAVPLRGAEAAARIRSFGQRHPDLKSFLREPDVRLVQVHVKKYRLVRHFEQVSEYSPT